MMKKILICCLSLFLLQGCKLETEVYNNINTSIFPKNAEHAKAMVTAIAYGPFRNYGYSGMYNAADGPMIQSELMSDYGQCRGEGWNTIIYGQWTVATDWPLNRLWLYVNNLSAMTLAIDEITQLEMDETLKKRYIAELHCARGWLAFSMYDLYGPIPIAPLEALKNPLDNILIPRLSEDEIKTFIVDELTQSLDGLAANYGKGDADYGRFTQGLANMVLMKFYMQTKQWTKAVEIGKELTSPKYGYALENDYMSIFTAANEKNKEIIWSINSMLGYQVNKWMPHVLMPDYPVTPSQLQKWGLWQMTWSFINTFDKTDKRLDGIITSYTGTSGAQHSESLDKANNGFLKKGGFPLKYEIDKTSTGEDSQIDWIVYRYADALTLLSEALVRKDNVISQEAIDLLNRVRVRAGLTPYYVSSFAGISDFLNKLLLERGHELYFEGVRRQDLIRHGVWIELIKQKAQQYGAVSIINSNYERLPIPQNVIDQSKGMIIQNPY